MSTILNSSPYIRKTILLLMFIVSMVFLHQEALAQSQTPILEILNDAITVDLNEEEGNTWKTAITLRNNGPEIEQLDFRFIPDGEDASTIKVVPSQTQIDGFKVRSFELEFQGVEKTVSGYLIVEANGVPPASKAITLRGKQVTDLGLLAFLNEITVDGLLAASLWIGLIGVGLLSSLLILIGFSKDRPRWTLPEILSARIMDSVNWNFSENWASTFVLLGGVFGTIVGSSVMPENSQLLNPSAFQLLNLVFPALVLLAPVAVAALNSIGREPRKGVVLVLTAEGKIPTLIIPFVFGSAIVTWAIVGELFSLAVLLIELHSAGSVSLNAMRFGQFVLGIVFLLGMWYAIERIVQSALTAQKRQDLLNPESAAKPKKPISGKMKGLLAQMEEQGLYLKDFSNSPDWQTLEDQRPRKRLFLP